MITKLREGLNGPLLVGLIVLAAWPFVFNTNYDRLVFTVAGIYAILTLGNQFIMGHAGALALTQGTFFGLGAYITGLTAIHYGWGFVITLPLSILGALLLALLVAMPVLRLASHYFALATLGIGQVVLLIAISWESVTGGSNGMPGVPSITIFGSSLPRGLPLLAFVWAFVAIAALISWLIMRGPIGRAFTVMRENEIAAMSIGIDVSRLRLAAFLLSSIYGGVAGALYVHSIRVISPEVLEFQIMVAVIAMTMLGGRTHVAGAILGAVLLVHLPEWFRFLGEYYLIAYGAILLFMIVAAPYGLVGAAQRLRERLMPEAPPVPPEPLPRSLSRSRLVHAAATPLLEIKDLTMSFGGVRAINTLSLTIERGEIFGLIGPNGSGKTTLINCITGIYVPQAGSIAFEGQEIAGLPPFKAARLGIARTFQNINLVDDMSALDNVAAAVTQSKGGMAKGRQEAMFLLNELDVGDIAMQPCGGLAYGVKRRVEIARALALNPSLLLLDEPAAGLNHTEQLDVAARLRKLASNGITLLVIEHNMPFIMPLATRMACLDYGSVIAVDAPAKMRMNSRVVEAYLGKEEQVA